MFLTKKESRMILWVHQVYLEALEFDRRLQIRYLRLTDRYL